MVCADSPADRAFVCKYDGSIDSVRAGDERAHEHSVRRRMLESGSPYAGSELVPVQAGPFREP